MSLQRLSDHLSSRGPFFSSALSEQDPSQTAREVRQLQSSAGCCKTADSDAGAQARQHAHDKSRAVACGCSVPSLNLKEWSRTWLESRRKTVCGSESVPLTWKALNEFSCGPARASKVLRGNANCRRVKVQVYACFRAPTAPVRLQAACKPTNEEECAGSRHLHATDNFLEGKSRLDLTPHAENLPQCPSFHAGNMATGDCDATRPLQGDSKRLKCLSVQPAPANRPGQPTPLPFNLLQLATAAWIPGWHSSASRGSVNLE